MINITAYLDDLAQQRAAYKSGVHHILVADYNRFVYPIAFILSFALMYSIINKIVYYKTNTSYYYNLCINKYNLKQIIKHSKRLEKFQKDESEKNDAVVLLENKKEEVQERTIEMYQQLINNEEVKYYLWFYRFSWMECINCIFCVPFLITIFWNFNTIHNSIFTYVTWDTYITPCMIMGHYLVDFWEVFSHGYAQKSKDLLLHHFIVVLTFTYHLLTMQNFNCVSIVLFVELNSFFNRFNLILKFHDPERINLAYNLSNIGNFLTMFLRFAILIRMYIYIGEYIEIIPAHYMYFIYICFVLIGMTYLAWTSLRYMIFNDLICVKTFLKKSFCKI